MVEPSGTISCTSTVDVRANPAYHLFRKMLDQAFRQAERRDRSGRPTEAAKMVLAWINASVDECGEAEAGSVVWLRSFDTVCEVLGLNGAAERSKRFSRPQQLCLCFGVQET